jgi:uncharacterized repeat protein (TIGR02543 family)
MKRNITRLLALALAFVLCVPAYAAEPQYTITILANNSDQATVSVGDVITVTLQLSQNGSDGFDLYSMQDYVTFDPTCLQFVEGSISVSTENIDELSADALAIYDYGSGDTNCVFVNRFTTSDSVALSNGVTLLTFDLKAIAEGDTSITHDTVKVFQSTSNHFTVSEQPATVSVVQQAEPQPDPQPQTVTASFSGGTGATGSTASVSATEGSTITLPSSGFSRSGYTFSGWRLGGRTYQPGASYTLNSSVTFTAQWTQNTTTTPGDSTNDGTNNGSDDTTGGNTGDNTGENTGGNTGDTNPGTGNTGTIIGGNTGSNTGTTPGSNTGSGANTGANTGSNAGSDTVDDDQNATGPVNDAANSETFTKDDGTRVTVTTGDDGSTTTETETSDGVFSTVVADRTGYYTSVSASIPAAVAMQAAESGETVTVPIEVKASETAEAATSISLAVPAEAGKVNVEIPVTEVGLGVVAVVVKEDGTEEIIQTCVVTDSGVQLAVSGDTTVKIIDNTKSFNDVTETYWGKDGITFVSARGIFNGTGDAVFSPKGYMTRQMVMTVLARLDGVDTSGTPWYEKGMAWAVENGISDGTNGKANVTREQLVTMLYRYAGEPETEGSLDAFPDAGTVSAYARNAMAWAVENGIINGNNGNLDPKGYATRAQVAAIIMRYCNYLAK